MDILLFAWFRNMTMTLSSLITTCELLSLFSYISRDGFFGVLILIQVMFTTVITSLVIVDGRPLIPLPMESDSVK